MYKSLADYSRILNLVSDVMFKHAVYDILIYQLIILILLPYTKRLFKTLQHLETGLVSN